MITIRPNTFETNSSSMHTFVISRGSVYKNRIKEIEIDFSKSYTDKELVLYNDAMHKATYIYLMLINEILRNKKSEKWIDYDIENDKHIYEPLTDDDININEKLDDVIKIVKDTFINAFKCSGVKVNFIEKRKNCGLLDTYKHDAIIDDIFPTYYSSFKKLLLKVIKNKDKKKDYEIIKDSLFLYGVVDFVLNPHSIIIGCNNSCSDEEKDMYNKIILTYTKKNKGNVSVYWV